MEVVCISLPSSDTIVRGELGLAAARVIIVVRLGASQRSSPLQEILRCLAEPGFRLPPLERIQEVRNIPDEDEFTLPPFVWTEQVHEREESRGSRGKEFIHPDLLIQREHHAFNRHKQAHLPKIKNMSSRSHKHQTNTQKRQLYGSPVRKK